MNTIDADNAIVAISDNSRAGRLVVSRAVRLSELMQIPVDIHHLLHVPNGEAPLTSGSIDKALDELQEAEESLRVIMHDRNVRKPSHASVDPDSHRFEQPNNAYVTFLTEQRHQHESAEGLYYLTYHDSPKRIDLSNVALLCIRDCRTDHLKRLSEMISYTDSKVQIILEEGVTNLGHWDEVLGESVLNNRPVITYKLKGGLRKILRKVKPSLVCIPAALLDDLSSEWLRKIHPMDILIY